MRRFLKQDHAYRQYDGLSMNWVQGANPDLIVENADGSEKETIDLTDFSYEGIHDLLQSKGFKKL